jgi:large conductance mechanosensitive channel
MPLLSLVVGQVSFAELAVTLRPAIGEQPALLLAYGKFVQAIFDFVIIAFAIFLAVKGVNRLRRREAAQPTAAPPAPTAEEKLLTEIRDLLKARN